MAENMVDEKKRERALADQDSDEYKKKVDE